MIRAAGMAEAMKPPTTVNKTSAKLTIVFLHVVHDLD